MSRKPNPVPVLEHVAPEKRAERKATAIRRQQAQGQIIYALGSTVVHDMYCKCGACESYRELLANEHE